MRRRLRALLLGLLVLRNWRRTRRRERARPAQRIVPAGEPDRRAELLLIVLLFCCTLAAAGFIAAYAITGLAHRTQILGATLGLSLAFAAAALVTVGERLIVTEEVEEDYPVPEHPEEQQQITQLVQESGSRFTRKRMLQGMAGTAGAVLGVALITPVASLGPAFDTGSLYTTPWRRGRRLVDSSGTPLLAAAIEQAAFYTAYPEGADQELIASPLIVVRLDPAQLDLPAGRATWAPDGILAYSKVCTHAGCAVSLYRKPTFPPTQPGPAFVCPCHYSTFDPAKGGAVEFGPAGRALPQLPLMIDSAGALRAAGNFSGPVGPSWWGVRTRGARS